VEDTLSDINAAYYLELINNCGIDRLFLAITNCQISEPALFLLDLASSCECIFIYQRANYANVPWNSAYLFGLVDADWVQIIYDMFARRMTNLSIDNYAYPSWITKGDGEKLMEMQKSIRR
ncbi:hypothetical protein PFISCL1PPCAC_9680, partial [Pristionchus fissidentatus]